MSPDETEIWTKNLVHAFPEIYKRRNNLVVIFIGANSPKEVYYNHFEPFNAGEENHRLATMILQKHDTGQINPAEFDKELKSLFYDLSGNSPYYNSLNNFCEKFGYNIEDVIFYSEWTRMRDGEVNRERDPDIAYVVFIDGHGQLPDHDPVEISEGYGDSGHRPASERLSYLKELDRDILLVIGPICFSKQVADIFLNGCVKFFWPQDSFTIIDGSPDLTDRMNNFDKALELFVPHQEGYRREEED